jgi:hypothetical protein
MAVAAQQTAQGRGRHERLLAWAGRGRHVRRLPHRTVQVTPDCDVGLVLFGRRQPVPVVKIPRTPSGLHRKAGLQRLDRATAAPEPGRHKHGSALARSM